MTIVCVLHHTSTVKTSNAMHSNKKIVQRCLIWTFMLQIRKECLIVTFCTNRCRHFLYVLFGGPSCIENTTDLKFILFKVVRSLWL